MGKRGPKAKTFRASGITATRPGPEWAPPDHLTGEARAAWEHVVSLLARAGNLDRTDPTLVECYAINVGLLREARATIDAEGVTVRCGIRAIAHPCLVTINLASMRIKSIVDALGLCPASSRFSASPSNAKTQPESKWSDLLGTVG